MDSRGAYAVREKVRGTVNIQGYSPSKLARWVRKTGAIPSLSGKDPVGHIHFLREQLKPELLEEACRAAGQSLELRLLPGYDHGYFFIQSFIAQHLAWHAQRLSTSV